MSEHFLQFATILLLLSHQVNPNFNGNRFSSQQGICIVTRTVANEPLKRYSLLGVVVGTVAGVMAGMVVSVLVLVAGCYCRRLRAKYLESLVLSHDQSILQFTQVQRDNTYELVSLVV